MALRPLCLALALCVLWGCTPPATSEPPSPATAAPVEKAVRDLVGGYLTAGTGDQARAALEQFGTQAFVAGLKAKAESCAAAAQSGTPPADCERDPVLCSEDKPSITAVVVTSVSGPKAEATAVLAAEGKPALNVRVMLADENATWKVQSIACP